MVESTARRDDWFENNLSDEYGTIAIGEPPSLITDRPAEECSATWASTRARRKENWTSDKLWREFATETERVTGHDEGTWRERERGKGVAAGRNARVSW